MASSSTIPSMVASGKATAKTTCSVHMPPEGVVVPLTAVVETTSDDHIPAGLEPLEEEGDSHKGEWRNSDITESDLKEMLAEGYLPTTEGLVWRAVPAGEVIPSP